MALEIKRASENFEELWNQYWTDMDHDDQMFWMEVGDNYNSLWINIDHEDFVYALQSIVKEQLTSLTITLRIAYKDGNGNVISGLTQEIYLTVNDDLDIVNECADVTIKPDMQLTTDYLVAFEESTDSWGTYKHFELEDTLSVDWVVAPADGVTCDI
jgi:hypothetical protein